VFYQCVVITALISAVIIVLMMGDIWCVVITALISAVIIVLMMGDGE
jgi:hypothetical protein